MLVGQNGKTTLMGRFLAALSIMGVNGGAMVYVYSVSRDKAADLIDKAREYINYCRDKETVRLALAKYGIAVQSYTTTNQTSYTIRSSINPDVVNLVRARPKGADSCRGDNPDACFFDEMGFIQANFWCLKQPCYTRLNENGP
jgi:phage terminase large subunit-like protein